MTVKMDQNHISPSWWKWGGPTYVSKHLRKFHPSFDVPFQCRVNSHFDPFLLSLVDLYLHQTSLDIQ